MKIVHEIPFDGNDLTHIKKLSIIVLKNLTGDRVELEIEIFSLT